MAPLTSGTTRVEPGADRGAPSAGTALLWCIAAVAMGALAVVSPGLATAAVASLLVLALAIVSRLRLLELVVVTAPFMFYVPAAETINASVSDVLLPALVFVLLTRRPPANVSRQHRRVLLYGFLLVAWMMLSFTVAYLSRPVEAGFFSGGFAITKVCICLVYLVAVFVLAAEAEERGDQRYLRLWGWTASGIAAVTLTDSLGMTAILRSVDGVRSNGTFEDPNLFGAYLAVSIAVAWLAGGHRPHIALLQTALMVAAAFTTGSRGTVAALAVLVVVAVAFAPSLAGRVKLGVALVVSGASFLVLSVDIQHIRGLDRLTEASAGAGDDIRLLLWERALEEWLAAPFLGMGAAQFTVTYQLVTHNTYLAFLSEEGIIGALIFVSGLIALFVQLLTNSLFHGRSRSFYALLGLSALAVSMLSLDLQNVRFVWIYAAVAAAVAATDRACPAPGRPDHLARTEHPHVHHRSAAAARGVTDHAVRGSRDLRGRGT